MPYYDLSKRPGDIHTSHIGGSGDKSSPTVLRDPANMKGEKEIGSSGRIAPGVSGPK
ncbi:hypothetical protein SBA4_1360015 [Candidatus Sulfopaludibacter sp. SbA4]|nr:hypothetical protein SBA4_1360015 [Candidatus Sulfopaludibacter sp. SbA4]